MQQDPDELEKPCFDPDYRQTVRSLANERLDYGRMFKDKYIYTTKIAGDLERLANVQEHTI